MLKAILSLSLMFSAVAQEIHRYTEHNELKLLADYGYNKLSERRTANLFCEAFGHDEAVNFSVKKFEYTGIHAYKALDTDEGADLEVISVSDYYATFNFIDCK